MSKKSFDPPPRLCAHQKYLSSSIMKDSFLYGSFQTAGLCVPMVSGFRGGGGVEIDQKERQGTGSLAPLSVLITFFSAIG